jgi:flavin-dependent dehydrogenase
MLSKQAEKQSVKVEYGHQMTEYRDGDEVRKAGVLLANGEKLEADVVIAADGIVASRAELSLAVSFELAQPALQFTARFKPLEDGTPVVELWSG